MLLLVATAIFITIYCHLFDDMGTFAKRRLVDFPFLTFVITPCFFWISAYLCRRYSPNASGHNLQFAINQLKKDPDDFKKISAFLNVRLIVVKTVSSLVSSFGGGALGKEGPSMHMSAGIFAIFANRYKKYLPKISLESWVIAGSAVGLTLVFNSPIAGVIFAAEKFSRISYRNFRQGMIFSISCVAVVMMVFRNMEIMFKFHHVNFVEDGQIWTLILLATVCALVAMVLKYSSNFLYQKICAIESGLWHFIPLIIGVMVAIINYYCGIYSFSGGVQTIQEALASDVSLLSYKEVGGRILNTILTFVSGSAGGLIAPAMAIGTGLGSIASAIFANVDAGVFLLIGMAAFLSVILGEPLAAAVLVLEATGQNIQALPFLLAATIIAAFVGEGGWLRVVNKAINDSPNRAIE